MPSPPSSTLVSVHTIYTCCYPFPSSDKTLAGINEVSMKDHESRRGVLCHKVEEQVAFGRREVSSYCSLRANVLPFRLTRCARKGIAGSGKRSNSTLQANRLLGFSTLSKQVAKTTDPIRAPHPPQIARRRQNCLEHQRLSSRSLPPTLLERARPLCREGPRLWP